MKAAVLTTPAPISKSPLHIEGVPTPNSKPGHVLLRVLACGVCRTDLHIVEGELPPRNPRVIPGHQIVGEIVAGDVETGPNRVGTGDHVGTPDHVGPGGHVGTGALARPVEQSSIRSLSAGETVPNELPLGSRVGVSWLGGT